MCLIAHRPVNGNGGSNIPNEVIDRNKTRNPDGFGIAWRDEQGLQYEKFAPNNFEAFRRLLKKIDKRVKVEYAAHWRLATHGPACLDLSHPFVYQDEQAGEVLVFHNGIIHIPTQHNESDTEAYVKRVLAKLPSQWWTNDAIKYLVENTIGWSRLLVMSKDETVYINQKDWKKNNGLMYSTDPLPYGGGITVKGKTTTGVVRNVRDTSKGDQILLPAQFRDDDDEGPDEDAAIIVQGQWYHLGHPVSPITGGDGDYSDEDFGIVVCDSCQTSGEYYVIEGRRFIDLRHQSSLL